MANPLIDKFKKVDTSAFPDFNHFEKPLEMGLWVLWIAKEKLRIKKLTADEIATIIIDVKEVSTSAKAITNSFNRAGKKIHTYRNENDVNFEIMKEGKEHLAAKVKEGSIETFYFEPDKRYSSKKILAKNILSILSGNLKIVDPYCGERTLDVLSKVKGCAVKFLTRLDHLKESEKKRLLRELQDFKSEHLCFEFRSYSNTDIHDRYVISDNILVILGHSIKDLGKKESFAVLLEKKANINIADALTENFNRRWKKATII